MSNVQAASELASLRDLRIYPPSVVSAGGTELGLSLAGSAPRLAVLASPNTTQRAGFEGDTSEHNGRILLLGPCNAANAAALRSQLPWLNPRTLGLRTSAGMGDRLGLATPGHVRAVRGAGGDLAPIYPQQSIREMDRTGRTPQQVMDDAMWGVFAEGWRDGYGADADHLKAHADIDVCVAAGYTFFTFDPGEHVQNIAEGARASELREAYDQLPWAQLQDDPEACLRRYRDGSVEVEGYVIAFDETAPIRAAVKYGRAVAHVRSMYEHLRQGSGGNAFEVEVSVDETESPTTHAEHVYIATELARLDVEWVSLAPRYVGRFEKGVDYIGDLAEFEADFAVHAAIARRFGPYKLSLHSGSDKLSIYEIAVRQTRGLVHLKTAGTSYLEALRTVAALDPELLREIYVFARDRYETDRASYHVSASLDRAPSSDAVADAGLPALLEEFDSREILHVTFGSVLTIRRDDGSLRFYDRLMARLRDNPEAYAANLEAHFLRHLRPFAQVGA